MNIIQDFIPAGRTNRPGGSRIPLKITIHDTANPAAYADADAHAAYLQTITAAKKPVSWHFTVDDNKVVQHLPISEPAWNAGDGHGPGNLTAIGIEICENADGDRSKAESNAAELVAWLFTQTKLCINDVVQHNHWSGKNCPHIIRARPNGWANFIKEVEQNMGYQMSAIDANKVITYLSASYGATTDKEAKAEFKRLANELRKASGQPVQ